LEGEIRAHEVFITIRIGMVHGYFVLDKSRFGPILVFSGIFGGGLFWLIACILRFDYLVNEVYNGGGPGEAIWAIDPVFTILAALPGLVLFLIGLHIVVLNWDGG